MFDTGKQFNGCLQKGSIYLTPYADNIIHFRYNPSGNNEETTKAGKNCGYKSSVMWE